MSCAALTGTLSAAGPKVSTYLLGCISLFLNTVCMVGPVPPFLHLLLVPHHLTSLPMQAVYVLLQKRFIFMAPNCEGCGALLH